MSYLAVCYGGSGNNLGDILTKTTVGYINDGGDSHHYWATMRNPEISLGDADGDDVDEITIAVTKQFVKTSTDTKDLKAGTVNDGPWDGYRNGHGITSVAVNDSAELLVTYSDNTTQNVGLVRTTVASPQLSDPLDAFVYTALGMAILSLLANGALAYAVYRVSRKKPKE